MLRDAAAAIHRPPVTCDLVPPAYGPAVRQVSPAYTCRPV